MNTKTRESKSNLKPLMWVGIGAIVIAAVMLVVYPAFAGYSFNVRGRVVEIDRNNKTIEVYVTHVTKSFPHVRIGGSPYAVRISRTGSGVFKANSAGKLVRLGMSSLKLDDEVQVVGTTRTDGSLDALKVIIR